MKQEMRDILNWKKAEDHWVQKIKGIHATSLLGEKTIVQELKQLELIVPENSVLQMKHITKNKSLNNFLLLLTVFRATLFKYLPYEKVSICSPTIDLEKHELSDALFFFVSEVTENDTFRTLLQKFQDEFKIAHRNNSYRLEKVMNRVEEKEKLACRAFGISYETLNTNSEVTKNSSLSLNFFGENKLEIRYDSGIYTEVFIQSFANHFFNILDQLCKQTDTEIRTFSLLTQAEIDYQIHTLNATQRTKAFSSVVTDFQTHVNHNPTQEALNFEGNSYTYQELDKLSNKVASFLIKRGVRRGEIIPIAFPKNDRFIITILGILKSGAAYLPIDITLPINRILFMLEDCSCKLVFSSSEVQFSSEFTSEIYETIEIEPILQDSNEFILDAFPVIQALDPAYVIYTSGSTGKPKGVVIPHQALSNFLDAFSSSFTSHFTEKDRCLSLTNVAFDVCVSEIFTPLTSGASLYLLSDQDRYNTTLIAAFIAKNRISFSYFPPVFLTDILGELKRIKHEIHLNKMLVGVEPIKGEILNNYLLFLPELEIINGYGPTETTVSSTFHYYQKETYLNTHVPIGVPILNTRVLILNEHLELVPFGMQGELYISGKGLALHYLNASELTEEKFISSPYFKDELMYRSGDIVKWGEDQQLHYIGRKDFQFKIRGYRIEIGEIELCLKQIKGIKNAVVIALENNSEKELCAYYVCQDKKLNPSEIKEQLTSNLPSYMIPAYVIELSDLPISTNGKIDRKNLPKPNQFGDSNAIFVAASSEQEKMMLEIWQEILAVEKIGITDSFFEIGGNSLKAAKLISKVYEKTSIQLPFREIFQNNTIQKLAEFISAQKSSNQALITPAPKLEYYPLSHAQQRIYLTQAIQPSSTNYNMPGAFILEGNVDIDKIENCFQQLVNRHEAFRTSFQTINGETVQIIQENLSFSIEKIKYGNKSIDELKNEFIRHFDLKQAPLLRVQTTQISKSETLLLIDMHHIISDGISVSNFLHEFIQLYAGKELQPLKIQYKDFAYWQKTLRSSQIYQEQEKFWLGELSDEIEPLQLNFDQQPLLKDYNEANNYQFSIGSKIFKQVNDFAQSAETTPYIVTLTAFQLLLSKLSNQNDVIVGTVFSGRTDAALEATMGMFVNTLPMRMRFENNTSVKEIISNNHSKFLNAYEYQTYPVEELAEKLNIQHAKDKHPYFQTLFAYQNIEFEPIELGALKMKGIEEEEPSAKFDFTLELIEEKDQFKIRFNYPEVAFSSKSIERISSYYERILEELSFDLNRKISSLNYLSEQERQLLNEFNETQVNYPKNQNILHLFDSIVENYPEKNCLIYEEKSFSYQEINEKANQLANYLKNKFDLQADDIVALLLERSEWTIIGILGVLKTGAAYLPIDSQFPLERINFILQDSQSKLILTDLSSHIKMQNNTTCPLEEISNALSTNKDKPEQQISPKQLAYVIYTSGSTGNPKGVMIEHQSLFDKILAECDLYALNHENEYISLLNTNYVFDVSLLEIFIPLVLGGTIVVPNSNKVFDYDYLLKLLITHQVTDLQGTPSFYKSFVKHMAQEDISKLALKRFCIGGESLDKELVNILRTSFKDVVSINNHYGPSEITIDALVKTNITEFTKNTIGKPMANTTVYILSKAGQLNGIGIPGEICIGGSGVARGYLNRESLNNEVFVENPFQSNGKLYKTGDLGKWTDDGEIEFLGRIDEQIKIRGYRIELGEIEHVLKAHSSVQEAIVLAIPNKLEELELIAYIHFGKEQLETDVLRTYLLKHLPEQYVPWHYVSLKEIPLTNNGKIDKKALIKINIDAFESKHRKYVAPKNSMEKTLVSIWEKLLERKPIGVQDNFFEIGGHSLKATRFISQVHKELKLEISLQEIFENPTIAVLSNILSSKITSSFAEISPVKEQAFYPVSNAQRRLWVLDQFESGKNAYNLPASFRIKGKLHFNALQEALILLSQRHDSLRTYFSTEDEQAVQVISQECKLELEIVDLILEENKESLATNLAKQDAVKFFDLSQAPLIRVKLLQLEEEEFIFLFNMHHIISDGWSINIIIQELMTFYNEIVLGEKSRFSPLNIQYKDYSHWQQTLLESDKGQALRQYWKNQFADEIPVLQLPTDRPRSSVKTFKGSEVSSLLPKKTLQELNTLAQQHGVSLFMLNTAIVKVLLHRYSSQENIVIGTPIAGRDHIDLEGLVGCFVNTLAIRTQIDPESSFKSYLKEVKRTTLQAFENQHYPFDKLVDEVVTSRDMSRSPLFDVLLVMENNEETTAELADLVLSPIEIPRTISKFDLSFYFSETTDGLHVLLEYNTDLFDAFRMEKMLLHLQEICRQVIHQIDNPIKTLQLTSSEEKRQILQGFNQNAISFPRQQTLIHQFEEQVRQHPNRKALIFENKTYSYQEVNEKANQLAHFILEQKDIQSNDIIAVMMERSEWMVIALLGILKTGAAYLPIDPMYPKERIEFMLEDSQAQLLLTESKWLHITNSDTNCPNFVVSESLSANKSKPEIAVAEDDLAYVIYTSGSTGKPKGVMVDNKAIVNRLQWMQATYPIDEQDVILQKTTFTFDVSVWELFLWGINGSTLCLLPPNGEKSPELIANTIVEKKVSVMHFVPSMLSVFIEYIANQPKVYDFSSLKTVYTSGEALTQKQVQGFYEHIGDVYDVQLINKYGPTEAAIDVTYFDCKTAQNYPTVPIGKPIANMGILILDKYHNIQAIGVPGELCIEGIGLAKGYLNRAELTAEKFISHPFKPGERLYRSGDLATWLPDGNISYIGRLDHQVKIRGFRIELGEIENQLLNYPSINEAVVVVKKDHQDQAFMSAFFVANETVSIQALKKFLATQLADYMIPTFLTQFKQMPLTANGKIDRKSLPDIQGTEIHQEKYEAATTEIEKILLQIWQGLLNVEKIGINDNFFTLGGDSIKAIQVASRLLSHQLRMEIGDLFQHPTIKSVSPFVTNLKKTIDQNEVSGEIPLTPIQLRFFEQGLSNENHYNQALMLECKTKIDEKLLEVTFDKLLTHHDALRMIFKKTKEGIVQYNRPAGEKLFALDVFDYTESEDPVEAIQMQTNAIQSGINIWNGPLVKLGLFKTKDRDHLLIVMHHLIIDGVSWRIFLEDFSLAFQQITQNKIFSFENKTHSFQNWSKALQKVANSDSIKKELEYWKKIEESKTIPLQILELNTEHQRHNIGFMLSKESTNSLLKDVNKAYGTEVNDILLSALSLSFKNWGGQDKIKINMEGHGRENMGEELELSRTVGWFTSVFPVLLEVHSTTDLGKQILETKNMLRNIPYKGISYGVLRYLSPQNIRESIVFDRDPEIEFNYLGQFDASGEGDATENATKGFAFSSLGFGETQSPENEEATLLSINCLISSGKLSVEISFKAKYFTLENVEVLLDLFQTHLNELIIHCLKQDQVLIEESSPIQNEDFHLHKDFLNFLYEPLSLIKWNQSKENLFFFPPALGISLAYREIAQFIDGRNIYGINFIEAENRIDTYVNLMIQKNGNSPFVLVGYSAGANLAFEVATKLLEKGQQVSDIILFDGMRQVEIEKISETDLNQQVESLIGKEDDIQSHPLLENTEIREQVRAKIKAYERFIRTNPNTTFLPLTIHQIKSAHHWNEENDSLESWNDVCESFRVYQGAGEHRKMLQGKLLEDNALIFNKILSQIASTVNS